MTESGTPASKLTYRADLQGLRAIAVVMVLLFHFQLLGTTGGFAGVDVFFVLSGYLMTAILRDCADVPAFRLLSSFWLRRIWRLAPALVVTVLVTVVVGGLVMIPLDYERLGQSAPFSVLFAGNYYFLEKTGYFSEAAVFQPLLHTWSLAVEMQFYIIWPLSYLVVRRFSFRVQAFVLLGSIILFYLACHIWGQREPDEVFFSTPFRLWQFGAGAALANPWIAERLPYRQIERLPVQRAALAALVFTLFFLTEQTGWPFGWGLVPTIASVVLIAGNLENRNTSSPVVRFLSLQPMQFMGEISYSLYLVHWPIVCLSAAWLWPDLPLWARIAGLALSFPLAWALFAFVEKPMRAAHRLAPIHRKHAVFAASSLATLATGLAVWGTSGLPQRYGEQTAAIMSTLKSEDLLDCIRRQVQCSDGDQPARVLLWGDSHAAHFFPGVVEASQPHGSWVRLATQGGCAPGPGMTTSKTGREPDEKCSSLNERTSRAVETADTFDVLVLAARWQIYFTAKGFGEDSQSTYRLIEGNRVARNAEDNRAMMERAFRQVAETTARKGIPVIVLGQVPNLYQSPDRCLQYAVTRGEDPAKCIISRADVDRHLGPVADWLSDLADQYDHVTYIDMRDFFCDESACNAVRNGTLIYRDDDHLTPQGSRQIIKAIGMQDILAKALAESGVTGK